MDKLDEGLLKVIEQGFGLNFEPWQKNYLLDIPMVLDMRMTGRGTGKTLVYIIKLLFADESPIEAYNLETMADHCDEYKDYKYYRTSNYIPWFTRWLIEIYQRLIESGLSPRLVVVLNPSKHTKERDAWVSPKLNFKY